MVRFQFVAHLGFAVALTLLTGSPQGLAGDLAECEAAITGSPLDPARLFRATELALLSDTAKYRHYIRRHPSLSRALDMESWDQETLAFFNSAIMELERDGRLGEVRTDFTPPRQTDPAAYERYRNEVFARQVAFSMYLEMNDLVPWKLRDYSQDDLDLILSRRKLRKEFISWDYHRFAAYPDRAFREQRILGSSRRETVEGLLGWIGRNITHVSGDPAARPRIGVEDFLHGGAHGSCHINSDAACVVSGALNIPCRTGTHGSGTEMHGHRWMDFPSERIIVTHGDNPYTRNLKERFLQNEGRVRFLRAMESNPAQAARDWLRMDLHGILTSGWYGGDARMIENLNRDSGTYELTRAQLQELEASGRYSERLMETIRARATFLD